MTGNGQETGTKMLWGYPLSSWIKSFLKHVFAFGALFGFAMFALLFLNR